MHLITYTIEGNCGDQKSVAITVNEAFVDELIVNICKGEVYEFDEIEIYETGTYTIENQNIHGCDSIHIVHLFVDTIDVSVTQYFNVLTANNENASAYQWIDCNTQTEIEGATEQVFIAEEVGDYAVIVTEENCSDISECFSVITVGTSEITEDISFQIFPNPVTDKLFIKTNNHVSISIKNIIGNTLFSASYGVGTHEIIYYIAGKCGGSDTIYVSVFEIEINNIEETICKGDSFFFDNQYLTMEGKYQTLYQSMYNCDSIVILSLYVTSIDTEVIQDENILRAQNENATYQWIDCSNNQEIVGETNHIFEAKENGEYAVIIYENSCVDTSDCFTVSTISIEELIEHQTEFIYPNPNNGLFELVSNSYLYMTITDVIGDVIIETYIDKNKTSIDISQYPTGVYFVKLTKKITNEISIIKVIKQ
jgi:predicted GNAT superfamily acetyltransferase